MRIQSQNDTTPLCRTVRNIPAFSVLSKDASDRKHPRLENAMLGYYLNKFHARAFKIAVRDDDFTPSRIDFLFMDKTEEDALGDVCLSPDEDCPAYPDDEHIRNSSKDAMRRASEGVGKQEGEDGSGEASN